MTLHFATITATMLRYVRIYPGVNSRAELVTLAPGLRPERRFAPLARGLHVIYIIYVNNTLLPACVFYCSLLGYLWCYVTYKKSPLNTAVKRNAHVRDLRKRGKNKGKLYTNECRLNKNTKYKKTPENIR